MENKRLSKVWFRHIPEELWPNILSRLPAKSLVRFRCVSRSWLSLINDPDFRRLHLNNNRDETRLLVVQGPDQNCVLRCSDTFEKKTGTLLTLGSRDGIYTPDGSWLVECSVDGLVVLSRRPDHLMLWNPSIRKMHEIPSLPKIETSPNEPLVNVEIGLGYDASVKDYKYVRFIFTSYESLCSVAIYTLGAASWRIIQSQDRRFPNWPIFLDSWTKGSVYLRGCLYFISVDDEERNVLVSFDLTSEVFCRTSLPDDVHSEFDDKLRLVDEGRSLAFFDFQFGNMWVWGSSTAESESMCWTKRYSFDLRVPGFLYINKNDDMLIHWREEKTTFRLATGKELIQSWTLVSSYNLQTQDEKILLQKESRDHENEVLEVFSYIESLTLL